MRHDSDKNNQLCIGYDLRVRSGQSNSRNWRSIDPEVWKSVQEVDEAAFRQLYSVSNISDVTNGLNLAVIPPPRSLSREEYVSVAFDAPKAIVEYMCDSFGLQHSIAASSNVLRDQNYSFVGYDVADLWTQTSYLFGSLFMENHSMDLNDYGLLHSFTVAERTCNIADLAYPDYSPFQPVGVWIEKK